MNHEPELPETLERFLETAPVAASDHREDLLRKTTSVLRTRRRRRRGLLVAGLAACYLAGLLTMRWWPARPVPNIEPPIVKKNEPAPEPTPTLVAQEIDPTLPAPMLERLAEIANGRHRQAHYLLAGKRYELQGKLSDALRCYRIALDEAASPDQLLVDKEDPYLLMVLKTERQKEKLDANNDT